MEAIKIPTNDEISQGVPSIVACGYRSIASTKTANLTFPAWLIRWSFGTSRETCEWWRTKRDFLLLHRAAARTRTSGSPKVVPLPKAALEKLSQRAPWRRMDEPDNHNIHNAPLEPGSSSLEEEEETRNNFHVSMKKSLLQMDTFLRDIHAQCCVDDGVDPILSSAWRDFCRPSHTTGLVDLSSSNSTENLATRRQEGARLGQYFCSSDNAARLVQRTLDWVTATCSTTKGDIVFLEPSCGNGQVVFELLQQLDHPKREEWKKGRRISIVGCDVDPSAIQACRARDTTLGRVEWILGDFLSSSPSGVWDDPTVVVLGGPPYTTGPGHGANITRRLPQQFLDACLQVWKAVFVAFLLPTRIKKTPLAIPSNWICETLELETSTFYWQGDIPVWQPSVLQCFYQK